jgi:FAD/FMN-containing dehydrogenase
VVIDLSPLKDIEVDPEARTVRVGGGCTWGEVDRATNEHGLATPSGIISTTGVGGLTLGGGLGNLARTCGLTIDNLLEAELVLANGERVRASADETPICTGRSGAAAATSGWSPRSSSGCTTWTRLSAARRSGPSRWRPRCSRLIASSCRPPHTS